jgi:hypothetical protein
MPQTEKLCGLQVATGRQSLCRDTNDTRSTVQQHGREAVDRSARGPEVQVRTMRQDVLSCRLAIGQSQIRPRIQLLDHVPIDRTTTSHGNVISGLNDIFGWHFQSDMVSTIKEEVAAFYLPTYEEIERSMREGHLVHVDDTRVSVKGALGCVWVFAGIQDVLYVYADSREADVVTQVLKDFKGVLVSDFCPAYESIPYVQQRCLIHTRSQRQPIQESV